MSENFSPLVMVVDDNPRNLQVLGSLLKENNYRVAVARDGKQVLEYLKTRQPDLILLDVMMPGINGFEVCKTIKKNPKTKEIPVLFITALAATDNKLEGFKAGGEDYITKPFLKEEVLARVNVFIDQQKNKKALVRSNAKLKDWTRTLEEEVRARTLKLQQMQSHIIMQEKMASIGQLAAGIAHELNNPINFIYTNFVTLQNNFIGFKKVIHSYQHLAEKSKEIQTHAELIETIREQENEMHMDFVLKDLDTLFEETREGFKRSSYIINSMRDFSRADHTQDFAIFDVNKGIQDTLAIARNEYKYHCEIDIEFGQLEPIECIPQQLNQVFLNIIVNAAQAIKSQDPNDKGLIRIQTIMKEDKIYCTISDNGCGIPDKIKKRIFEPFFTTKEVGQGTGLGLSIAYDIIVNKHNGTLTAEKNTPKGTRFIICLPCKKDLSNAQ